jgi:hypothetical protein
LKATGFGRFVLHCGAVARLAENLRRRPSPVRLGRVAAPDEHVAGGTAALMAMRKELLGHLGREPALKLLDADLQHLFAA